MALQILEMGVTNTFITRYYDINDTEGVHLIKWLGWEGLQFIKALTLVEQEACETVEGLLNTLDDKFNTWHDSVILSQTYKTFRWISKRVDGQAEGQSHKYKYKEIED